MRPRRPALSISSLPLRPAPQPDSLRNLRVLRVSALDFSSASSSTNPPQPLRLFPRFPYFPTSLLPYFPLCSSRDEKPVTATPLDSALTKCDARKSFRIRSYANCRVSPAFFSIFPGLSKVPYTLPSSVYSKPFICHSYENCRVWWDSSHSGTRPWNTQSRWALITRHSEPTPLQSTPCPKTTFRPPSRLPRKP